MKKNFTTLIYDYIHNYYLKLCRINEKVVTPMIKIGYVNFNIWLPHHICYKDIIDRSVYIDDMSITIIKKCIITDIEEKLIVFSEFSVRFFILETIFKRTFSQYCVENQSTYVKFFLKNQPYKNTFRKNIYNGVDERFLFKHNRME